MAKKKEPLLNQDIEWVPSISNCRKEFTLKLKSARKMNQTDILWALGWYLEEITDKLEDRTTNDTPN